MFRFNVPVVYVTTLNIILMLDNLLAWFVRDASKYTSWYLLSRYEYKKNNEKILHLYLSKIMLGSRFTYYQVRHFIHFLHFQSSLMFSCKNGFILLAVCLIRFYLFLKDDPNSVSEILPDGASWPTLIRLRGHRTWDKQLNCFECMDWIWLKIFQNNLLA